MNEHDYWRTWAPPDEDKTDDEPQGLDDDSSAAWEHETRQVKRKLEMQPSSSSSLARPKGEAVLSQTAEKPVRKMTKHPTKSSKQESRAVFLSMGVTSSASQQKRSIVGTSGTKRDSIVSTERGGGSSERKRGNP